MNRYIRIFVLLFLLCPCIKAFSQNTVIHDIPWHSDTVGMWGSGSTVWSINQIDTLVDFTIGPYNGHYSYVYNLPWPLSDSVGVIFDYGAYLYFEMVFEMVGWTSGSVHVNYPTKITMNFPPAGSFTNGAWLSIPSNYREHDTIVYPTDPDNWDISAAWPQAGKIQLFINMNLQAHADIVYSNPLDPFNITWDTIHIFPPMNVNLDTFNIFLVDLVHNQYVIPWVAYHTDPITGATIIDSIYFLHDSIGWPMQFPPIFYSLIGISGWITIPNIQNYTKWITDEQRLFTHGSSKFLYINLDIVKFIQQLCSYMSNIPGLEELAVVSQVIGYLRGDTSIYLFTDPISGEDFDITLQWDLLDLNLLFTNTLHQTLAFEEAREYTLFGVPVPPLHYPNVWNTFKFPVALDYQVLDTNSNVVETGTSDSIKWRSEGTLKIKYPCYYLDSLPVNISHSIDPWLTNTVVDSVNTQFYIRVLYINFSIGEISNPIYQFTYTLYQDTINLGTFAIPLFAPPIFMPWLITGFFIDTTFVPDKYLVPNNNPLHDSLTYNNILCYGASTGSISANASGGAPPYTYLWTSGTDTIGTTATISNLPAGSYYITLSDANGCSVMDSVTLININPQINITYTTVNVLCYGNNTGSATLTVTGGTPGYQYAWLPNVGTTAHITNLFAGTYYVTVTDNVGCTDQDTIIITQPDSAIIITVESITNVTCFNGSNGAIDISVAGGVRPYTYHWSNGSTQQDLNNIPAGVYIVTVTDAHACKLSDTITVTQPAQVISYAHNYKMCLGQTITIGVDSTTGGTPPYTYSWNTGDSTVIISVSPTTTTTYTVHAIDVNGCLGIPINILVQVTKPLTMHLSLAKDSICFGDSTLLYANITGGGGPPYVIFLSNGQSGPPPLYVAPTTTTTYVVTVWDTCHFASLQDSIKVTVLPLPIVSFAANPESGCQPLTVQFTDLANQFDCQYSWNFGDGTSGITTHDPLYTYYQHGTYSVTLQVTSQYGCINTLTMNNMITVWPKPTAIFIMNPTSTSMLDPLVFFGNESTTTYESFWNFGDGSTSNVTNPVHDFPRADTFNIMLIATSEHGCLDTAWKPLIVKEYYTLWVPNAFTPDGNGLNDVFIPKGNLADPNNYEFLIFDRWGNQVFETRDVNKGWDGTINGNMVMVNTVFAYVIIFKDRYGLSHKQIGSVTLIHNAAY